MCPRVEKVLTWFGCKRNNLCFGWLTLQTRNNEEAMLVVHGKKVFARKECPCNQLALFSVLCWVNLKMELKKNIDHPKQLLVFYIFLCTKICWGDRGIHPRARVKAYGELPIIWSKLSYIFIENILITTSTLFSGLLCAFLHANFHTKLSGFELSVVYV